MKTEKIGDKFQAITYIGHGYTRVSFIGFGDTNFEAISNCLGKIYNFYN